MLTPLWAWLVRFISFWGGFLAAVVTWVNTAFKWLATHFFWLVIAFVIFTWRIVNGIIAWVNTVLPDGLYKLNQQIDSAQNFGEDLPDQLSAFYAVWGCVAKFNYILPVDEFFTAMLYLAVWYLMVALYKFIKSWIPSMSSS